MMFGSLILEEKVHKGKVKLALSSAGSVLSLLTHCSTTYPDPFLYNLAEKLSFLCFLHSFLEVKLQTYQPCQPPCFTMRITDKYDIWFLFLDGHLCSCPFGLWAHSLVGNLQKELSELSLNYESSWTYHLFQILLSLHSSGFIFFHVAARLYCLMSPEPTSAL